MNTFLKVQLTLKILPMFHRKRFALSYIVSYYYESYLCNITIIIYGLHLPF